MKAMEICKQLKSSDHNSQGEEEEYKPDKVKEHIIYRVSNKINSSFSLSFTTTAPILWHLSYDKLGQMYQKDKIILNFVEARDDGLAVASAGPYASYLHFTPRQITPPAPVKVNFMRWRLFHAHNQQCQSIECTYFIILKKNSRSNTSLISTFMYL